MIYNYICLNIFLILVVKASPLLPPGLSPNCPNS